VLAARLLPSADLGLTQTATLGEDGWVVDAQLLLRAGRGTAADPPGVQLVSGCDGSRTAGELLAVLGATHGFPAAAGIPAVRHLVGRGILLPGAGTAAAAAKCVCVPP